MADYDSTPPVYYDSGVRYDQTLAPPTSRKPMAKVRLNLKDKSDSDLVTFTQQHITAVTGNANFTTLLPAAAGFATAFTAYSPALNSFTTAQQAARQATTVKDNARLALEALLTQRGNYVDLTAAGDAAKIQSAGFEVKAAGAAPTLPNPVANLAITAGDNAGELDLTWDPVPKAKTYEIETSPDPITATSWTNRPSVPKSRATLTGLTSGARVWAHVRAVGAAGQGAWSDPATKIVP